MKTPQDATEITDGSSAVHIRLLGEPRVDRSGREIVLPASKRTRALFGFLVADGTVKSRQTLCDLLWDGSEDPRASLRWSLSKLRDVVDDDQVQRLVSDRERVGFDSRRCEVDIHRARTLIAEGVSAAPLEALKEAAELLQKEFLDGLDLPACYRFHHWCMAERERYGALRRGVLEALILRLSGEPERALQYGRSMVAADPLAETTHASLVRLLAAAGRYPEAERHYDWARELLQREVVIPPGGPLDEEIHRARRERRSAGALAGAPPSPVPVDLVDPSIESPAGDTPTLLGRALECALIAQTLTGQASQGLLLFLGEPGIGKTRLLDHIADSAAAVRRRVIRGRCFEPEMVRPYGPWLDAFRGVLPQGVSADIQSQVALLLTGQPVEGSDRERLFGAAAALVRRLAALHPLVIVLDDLQWVDEGSAALLHFLVRTFADGSEVLFAGAARSGEIDDNPCTKGLLHSLVREGSVRRLEPAPLGLADVRTLIGTLPLDATDAWRQTGGNPLYLVELTYAAQRGSAGDGRRIDALIEERLRSLDEGSRELLAWAAAMGCELRPYLLANAAGLPVPEVLAKLERLERRGLVAPTGQGNFDFAHDLVRQVTYRSLSQPRRRAIHRQFARTLAESSAESPLLHGEILHHAELAGDTLVAVRACLATGEHCLRMFANAQAEAVAERGLAHVDELAPGAERVRLEIGLLRLRVAAAAGPGGRRLPALAGRIERAIAAAEVQGLHVQAASGWEILAYWLQQASDSAGTQVATLAAERLARRADATTRCLQLANSGRCLLDIESDVVRGRALLDEAAALADGLDLKVMEVDWGRGLIARAGGDLDAARRALTRAVALARLADNHWREFECMVWLATVELEQGALADVLQHVSEIIGAASRMGEPQAPFAQALGALARWHQRDPTAEAALAADLDALRELDDKTHLAYALNEAAALALCEGRRELAADWAGEAYAAAQAVRRSTEITVAIARLACAAPDARCAAEWLARLPAERGASARAVAAIGAANRIFSTVISTAAH